MAPGIRENAVSLIGKIGGSCGEHIYIACWKCNYKRVGLREMLACIKHALNETATASEDLLPDPYRELSLDLTLFS